MATTTNLDTLKINYLTQSQYDTALTNNEINNNEIYLTPNDGADYVVETGSTTTSGISWTYRKWNSGICDLWGTYVVSQAPYNTTVVYGYWYRHMSTIYFPFPIKEVAGSYTVNGGNSWAIPGVEFPYSLDGTPNFIESTSLYSLTATSGTVTMVYKMTLHGKWK